MRAINFMKIDYIRTKQQMYFLPLFGLISIVLSVEYFSIIVGVSYIAFLSIIFSTSPFGACQAKDAGFLVLLPSRARDRVMGRFLYGISFIVLMLLIDGILIMINRLMGRETELWMLAACLIILAIGILGISLEFLLLYLIGEHMAGNLLGIVRVVPGMALFFFAMRAMEKMEEGDSVGEFDMAMLSGISRELTQIGVTAIIVSLAVLAAVIVVCIRVTKKRDYV